ncbi:hypothetical protein [Alicyclobacillus acidocaldarius]|uniref:Uncharacterized protein n=1 Tax=Alicyclobacillus acidocaldarius subsp. acidocaldarius (strain ATCC 27009 / DSM 446 / BCRC 14685 / JCM 5260 / KCTC 1825 / NBRC 15652 / NCIMB 11725 / NRRL B-14509 / 104-IA) TaxID=521098 RepID=C8WVW1_ALIAD|nr:hypothetical protein [Alicyclobacillus acidocaldarius]ACV58233.1 hypothetical protein Aaci_1202 [Alicyclobacillus acidocaldarius subsp. acidocaldarius DSM 446]
MEQQLRPETEALMQRITDGTFDTAWRAKFWTPLKEDEAPTKEYLVKFLDREAAETHCPVGILTYVMDYPFFDTDDEITKALMRLEIVKPLHHDMTMVGVRSKIVYGPVLILDNTQPPPWAAPDEAEEYEEMEWSDEDPEDPVEWNIFNDRTLIQSLVKNGALAVMERADVFVLRGDAALRKAAQGHCGSCRYFVRDERGGLCTAYYQRTGENAPIGRSCTDFYPRPETEKPPKDRYVLLEADDIYIPPYTANALFEDNGEESDWLKELKQEIRDKLR